MFYNAYRTLPLDILEEGCLRVVVGNKVDIVDGKERKVVSLVDAESFAKEINPGINARKKLPCFEVSSKTGDGVKEIFEYIYEHCLSDRSREGPMRYSRPTQPQVSTPRHRVLNLDRNITVINVDGITYHDHSSKKGCCN